VQLFGGGGGGRVIELYFMALLTPQTMQYKADSDAAAGLH